MALTEQEIDVISDCPFNDRLDHIRYKLRDLDESDNLRQDDISPLLGALVCSPVAFSLLSRDGSGSVAVKLFSVLQHTRGGGVKSELFRSLVRRVTARAPDIDIWEAVFSVIETLGALTPPPSIIAPTCKGTPVKANSSRLADSETRDIVEGELFVEIKDCVYRGVEGFWDKHFDSNSWREEQKTMLNQVLAGHDGGKWNDFPSTPDEKSVWDWLRSLEEHFLADAPHKLYTTESANHFKERRGQIDIFFQKDRKANSTFTYKDVLVVGEQKKSYDTSRFKADLLQLTRHVRSVFVDQPTRRFVHAFSLCASKMELWVFDRSGPYSSGLFDIHDEPDKFARALVGYATMDSDAMGLDTFIERKEGHRYATLEEASGNETRINLEELMVRQRAIVCRGTTCYRTQNGYVAKFSWASDKRKPEVDHLRLAGDRGVKGVARVVAHRQITTIADMRKELEFPKSHRFRDEDVHFRDLPSAAGSTNTTNHKRKSSSDNTSGSKRRRSSGQKSKLRKEIASRGEDPFMNKIYSCLIVSPAGRVISDFTSIKELLESLRDAIRAHQSLYVAGNILHRDVSSNNVIITDPKIADGFKGMLIDLDLAQVRDNGPSRARHRTGTMQFMAIEVLRKADHTYRHDLESFFYVLLWMCARYSWTNGFRGKETPPMDSVLRKWEIGSFRDIADAKVGHMTVNGLEGIMGEFPKRLDIVKPLCLRIRSIMFGDTARMVFGTPAGDPDQLYKPIIAAYDEAVGKMD